MKWRKVTNYRSRQLCFNKQTTQQFDSTTNFVAFPQDTYSLSCSFNITQKIRPLTRRYLSRFLLHYLWSNLSQCNINVHGKLGRVSVILHKGGRGAVKWAIKRAHKQLRLIINFEIVKREDIQTKGTAIQYLPFEYEEALSNGCNLIWMYS